MSRESISHLSLFNVPGLFSASKNLSYRKRILMRALATANVFTAEGIATLNLNQRYEENPEKFLVKIGELTDEGLEFARDGYQRWLKNTDRWTGEFTQEKLNHSLVEQWRKYKNAKL